MSSSIHNEERDRVELDGLRICKALASVMDERDISSIKLSELTGIPEANIRRMMTGQEPKGSTIAQFERALRVPLGTISLKAGLHEQGSSVVELLGSHPELHPVLRRSAVVQFREWLRLSAEMSGD